MQAKIESENDKDYNDDDSDSEANSNVVDTVDNFSAGGD